MENAADPHLSGLLTRRLVLGSLAEIFYSLVFGQEVLLLRHFLSLDALVQQLPVDGPNRGNSWFVLFLIKFFFFESQNTDFTDVHSFDLSVTNQ